MRAADVVEHFLSRAEWVDRAKTVDRVIAGDPAVDVERCVVTWMPSYDALRAALARDVRLVVCHEPTFWNHRDETPDDDVQIQTKLAFIRDNELTVVRNHDAWDRWPEIGIPWAWARHLGLGPVPVDASGVMGYQHRYDIEPVSLGAFARRVAAACAALGEGAVQVSGDLETRVGRIGVGTGCACLIDAFQKMGCDCSIVCDDGTCYWRDIERAKEQGHPVIRVNHGTSEEPGMVTLARYINENVDGLSAEHLPHGSVFRLVGTVS